jgi:glycosyltransferase involved in cell wall biosynthesis
MKVLHVLHELKFSGAEIMYVDAAPILRQKGCELTVMATAEKLGEYAPFFKNAGYEIIHKPIPPLKFCFKRIKFYIEFIKLLKKDQYNVVHIHSHPIMWSMALCAWIANVKSVYTFHNVFPTRFLTYPYHCLLRWSAKYIFKCRFQTISDAVYDHELKFYHNKTTKIYNWYGHHRFHPASSEEKETARKDLGIDRNLFVLISVGGCSAIKNHSEIIKSLPIILEKIPNCLYLHLGSGNSETEEIQLAKTLGVENSIKFCGNQTNLRKYLIASDVYLMTSRFEGISLTTIEAMACDLTAILYDAPGLRDFNKYGENSILISEDFHLLAEKVIYIHANPQFSSNMTIKAKNFVNKSFNMETNANKIIELYN